MNLGGQRAKHVRQSGTVVIKSPKPNKEWFRLTGLIYESPVLDTIEMRS